MQRTARKPSAARSVGRQWKPDARTPPARGAHSCSCYLRSSSERSTLPLYATDATFDAVTRVLRMVACRAVNPAVPAGSGRDSDNSIVHSGSMRANHVARGRHLA